MQLLREYVRLLIEDFDDGVTVNNITPDEHGSLFGYMNDYRHLTDDAPFMKLLQQKFPGKLPSGIGSPVGKGVEGHVFNYGSGKVIKILITDKKSSAQRVLALLKRHEAEHIPPLVTVFSSGFIGRLELTPDPEDAMYVLYYVAEKLTPTEDLTTDQIDALHDDLARHGIKASDINTYSDNVMQNAAGELKVSDLGRMLEPLVN